MLTLLVNGEIAGHDDLLHLALVNYGAFTSMQAEQADGVWSVRGLDLHMARLRDAGLELFGQAPDENARITEGSIWNIGFLKGDTVVWPQGPMLAGTGQALLQRGLEAVDVTTEQRWVGLPELPDFDAAFITNSAIPAVGVSVIGAVRYPERPDLMQLLTNASRSNPCQPV